MFSKMLQMSNPADSRVSRGGFAKFVAMQDFAAQPQAVNELFDKLSMGAGSFALVRRCSYRLLHSSWNLRCCAGHTRLRVAAL
jgi:hypothetical protein